MTITAYLDIPKMFNVYANSLGRNDAGFHCIQYFCQNCEQMFTVAWGRVPGSMSWCERGTFFHCPNCGEEYNTEREACFGKTHDHMPLKVSLTVKEYANIVDLEVRYEAHVFREQFDKYYIKRMEIFRFDIAARRATFSRFYHNAGKREIETTFEFGSPLEFQKLFAESILRFFRSDSIPNKEQHSKLAELLKTLRRAVKSRLEKRLGYELRGFHVSPGSLYGYFLLPLMNIGYRLIFPDAPNLPEVYRDADHEVNNWLAGYLISKDTQVYMERAVEEARTGTDAVSAIIRGVCLPNKDLVRRELRENFFHYGWLASAFATIDNYDLAMRFYRAVRTLQEEQSQGCHQGYMSGYHGGRTRPSRFTKDVAEFARAMRPIYGEEGVVRMVEAAEEYRLDDCMRLYSQMNDTNRKLIKRQGVRLRDLHDWMAKRHKEQMNPNIKFKVPEHIVRRLAMQRDRLSFFLPKESMELLEAGQALHNCVASYGKAMGSKDLWIVLVADDNGRLAACLEIKKDKLVQAKLDCNKPVHANPALNAEVLAWAEAAGVKIATKDVRLPADGKAPAAAAAG